jgi:capsular polysaccharide biosynthesis protein
VPFTSSPLPGVQTELDYLDPRSTPGRLFIARGASHVSLIADQESVVFRVVGHDPDPKTAADIANTAAVAFAEALNAPGVGVGSLAVLSPAEPNVPAHPVQAEKDALAPILTSCAVALVVVLAVGMAVGFALGRLSPAHRDGRRPGAAQDPLF